MKKAKAKTNGKDTNKKKRIVEQIVVQIGRNVVGVMLLVAITCVLLMMNSINKAKTIELTLESQVAAQKLTSSFGGYESMIEVLAEHADIVALMENAKTGDNILETEGFPEVFSAMSDVAALDTENILAVWIADIDANVVTQTDGFTSSGDWEITERAWFYCTQIQETILTEPYTDASTGQTIISMATAVKDANGKSLGVAGMDISMTQLTNMMEAQKIGKAGYVTFISKEGKIVYHPQAELCQTMIADMDISDNVKQAVANGEEAYLDYKELGVKKHGYVANVGATGYKVLSCLPTTEYYADIYGAFFGILGMFAAGIVFIVWGMTRTSAKIVAPIVSLNETAQQLADGNLDVEINVTTEDEVGQLGHSIEATVVRLKEYIVYIDEIADVLAQMADGKLVIQLKQDYAGEFQKVKDALLNISASMTNVMKGIAGSAEQVAGGADELSTASQSLAEGAGMQAAAVEELLATVIAITEQVEDNKKDAESAALETEQVTSMMEASQAQMNQMIEAMENIRSTSQQVVGIIRAIEEIADQTNLLSLNASIEAARAGEVGKGFAVVAGEIGKLAEESGKAVNTTRELINESMNEIAHGNSIVEDVVSSIRASVDAIENVNGMIQKTSENATYQAMNMEQIKDGIEDISQGIQDNSAIAQEASATSEELAAQATTLNSMVQRFEIE